MKIMSRLKWFFNLPMEVVFFVFTVWILIKVVRHTGLTEFSMLDVENDENFPPKELREYIDDIYDRILCPIAVVFRNLFWLAVAVLIAYFIQ